MNTSENEDQCECENEHELLFHYLWIKLYGRESNIEVEYENDCEYDSE